MIATFSYPTRVHFGPGSLSKLADAAGTSRRPLIVTDGGIAGSGIAEKVKAALGDRAVAIFTGVEPNPTEANIRMGVTAYLDHDADLIVAVGGGSPLDVGKAIRLAITHKRPLVDYDDLTGGDRFIGADLPPMIAIPTTSGTGSEVSRSTVVTLEANDRKTVLFSPYLMPTVAVCDPELTLGLPPRLTAATGMDALSHNLEAYLAKGYHPMADAIALEGLRLIAAHLERAVHDGSDLEARSQMMMASLMGATAFQKGLGATHSLAHPLSSVAGVHHGTANAILMPAVIRFNEVAVPERCRTVAEALGHNGAAAEAIERLNAAIGMPARLSEVGVTEAMIPVLVPKAMVDGCHQSNPRPLSEADFGDLYRQSL
jgi:4-hydroxybutyrate dehydrogenase